MRKHTSLALGASLLLALPSTAQNWLGAMDSNWNNPANWSDWPLDDENVSIDPALYSGAQASPVLSGNSAFIPDRLFAQNGAVVALNASLTVADRFIISTGASVSMGSGTLTTDRLIMEGGGSFTLNAGTVNATGVLALGDDGTAPSTMVQNGGAVNVSGEFGFDVELGISSPSYQLVQGMLTVNGDAIWFGTAPGGGQGRLLVEGGTAQINGSVMNTNGSTLDLFIHLINGQLLVNGPTLDLAHSTDSLLQSNGVLMLNDALVLENDGVVQASAGELQVLGAVELRGVGSTRFHHVTILADATLLHSAPDELEVGGHWDRAGDFDADNNTVTFAGTTQQTVSATPFHGLRVNNDGPGITLGMGTTSVAGGLVLDAGVVHTTNSALLQLQQGATATAGSAASHVDGPLRKVGNADFVFPVGNDGNWRRIAISGINDQDTEFTAEYLNTGYANTSSLQPGLSAVSSTEHWRLERAVTNDDVQVELYWEDAAASNLTDCATLAVAHWNGSSWAGHVSSTTGSCTGNNAGTAQSDDAVPDYEVFTFGTSDGSLSVAEHTAVHALTSYPQPADAGSWIMLPEGTTALALYDLTGIRIAQQAVMPHSDRLYVPTGALATGLYLVQASSAVKVLATGRLVVAH